MSTTTRALAATFFGGALALSLATPALADDLPEAGQDCNIREYNGDVVELEDGTVLDCQDASDDNRPDWVWVDVTPEDDDEPGDGDDGEDEPGNGGNDVTSTVAFNDNCDATHVELTYGNFEGEYRATVYEDGEDVWSDSGTELGETTVKDYTTDGTAEVRVHVEHKEDGGDFVTVLDKTHDHAPAEELECDEPGNGGGTQEPTAECGTLTECVQALIEAGKITEGSEVYIKIDAVYYLCVVGADGEVSYEKVTEEEATADEDAKVYKVDADGFWHYLSDGGWVKVDTGKGTPDDDPGKGDDGKDDKPTDGDDAKPVEGDASDSLPVTGGALAGLVAAGLAALSAGGGAVYLARKRKATADNGGVDE